MASTPNKPPERYAAIAARFSDAVLQMKKNDKWIKREIAL